MSLRLCFIVAAALFVPGTAQGDQYFVGDRPELLLGRSFPCPPEVSYDEESGVQVHVGADGFVDSLFFVGTTPPDSAIIRSIASRWIFRPATFWGAGPNPGEPRGAWLTIRYRDACEHRHSGRRVGPQVLEQPDSVLRARVRDAREVT